MNLPFSNRGHGSAEPSFAYDARPLVAIRRKDRLARWFAVGAFIAALLLFISLEARRQGSGQSEQARGGTMLASPETVPELVIPPLPAEPAPLLADGATWRRPGDAPRGTPAIIAPPTPPVSNSQPYSPPRPGYSGVYEPPLPSPSAVDPAYSQSPTEPTVPQARASDASSGRVMAGRLENPATTVIQGTLINAVLETALDSTRPGQARAVVTRDVYGFDGSRLLVPRGSRLYGSYEADVAQGQKRAQIQWTRLIRPDGVWVALDSPVADPLGRAGVRGKVNNHFFQRLGNALLGTAGNIGSALVTRNLATSPVVVAVPGAAQAVQPVSPTGGREIMPTLTVKQGTRISVFVQHDLDFSSVEEAP